MTDLIDAELLIYSLLERDVQDPHGIRVESDIDVNQLDQFPAVLFRVSGPGQSPDGRGLWPVTMTANVFGDGINGTFAATQLVYRAIHGWNEDPAATVLVVDGNTIGWVNDVEDVDLFSRLAAAEIAGRNVVQYAGAFALQLRNT